MTKLPSSGSIGQVDWRGGATIFGVPLEGQGISLFAYENGVQGLLLTGYGTERKMSNRLVGSDGVIEVTLGATSIRVKGKGMLTGAKFRLHKRRAERESWRGRGTGRAGSDRRAQDWPRA